MPIEIKELHIKVSITENTNQLQRKNDTGSQEFALLRQQVIDECTTRIIEKLKEREER